MKSGFLTRLLSGIVLLVIMIFAIYFGGDVLFGLLLVVSLIGMYELYKVLGIEKSVPGVLGYLAGIGYFVIVRIDQKELFLPVALGFLLLCMAFYVFFYPKFTIKQIMGCFFGLFYVACMLGCIYEIRILKHGIYLVWFVFLGSWGSDTCAYCAGRLFGKHKAFPVLSPKKSWEGCVGGVFGAALLGLVYMLIFGDKLTTIDNGLVLVPVVMAVSSIIAQIGDLAASAIKRECNIKDYSNLIPGHGGILDRFDSVIFTAPIVYYLLAFIWY